MVYFSRVWYRLIEAVKILTARFGENFDTCVIHEERTLDFVKMTRIVIHEIFRYNTNQQILIL